MNKINALVIFSTLFISVSCNKQLDLPNDGRIVVDEVFSDYNSTRGYLNSCYGFSPVPSTDRASLTSDSYDAEDIISGNRYSRWYNGDVNQFNFGGISTDGSPWGGLFTGIRKCNVFLKNLPNTPDFELASDLIKEGWGAQARTLRALYYLQLIKRYGPVPIMDEELPLDVDYSTMERSPVSEVVQFILDDCRKALEVSDDRDGFHWEIFDNQNGMMTRGVAYAIMSEAVTYAASPLFSDGTITWKDATEINAEALGNLLGNGYELFDEQPQNNSAVNAYALYFLTNPNQHAVDHETIYARGAKQQIWRYSGLPSTPNQERAGHGPTQELVDSYEMINGEAPIEGYSDPDHLQPIINPSSGYSIDNPYVDRDPRFYATIFFNEAERLSGSGNTDQPQDLPITLLLGSENMMDISEDAGIYQIHTTGGDPYIATSSLSEDLLSNTTITLSFEYKSSTGVGGPGPEFFFSPIVGGRSVRYPDVEPASGWTTYSIDISEAAADLNWGKSGDNLRFDVGDNPNKEIEIRDIKITTEPIVSGPDAVETFIGGADAISSTNRRNTRTGYYLRKYFNHVSNISNQADGYTRMFRLAEIYLNFAESAYQSDGPDQGIQVGSQSMSARDAVNFVRARAGMPDLPTGLTTEEFETRYRNERRVELAFEEHRYFDVRRWKILDKTDKVVTGMRITKDDNEEFNYERFNFPARQAWEDRFLLYPLDKSEVDKMFRATNVDWQNPGWD